MPQQTAAQRQQQEHAENELNKTRVTAVRRSAHLLSISGMSESRSLLDKEEDCCSRATD